MQMIYQIISAYFEDDGADELTIDPVFNAILEKNSLASQPTLSRFFNRMDEDTLLQFDDIDKNFRDIIYSIKCPEHMLLDLDSSWNYPRRVFFKIEKPYGQLTVQLE